MNANPGSADSVVSAQVPGSARARPVHLQLRGLEHERDDQRHHGGPGHDRDRVCRPTITLFLLIMAILMIPCSKLTDRWGRKRCFTVGPRAVRDRRAAERGLAGPRRADPRQLGARGRRHRPADPARLHPHHAAASATSPRAPGRSASSAGSAASAPRPGPLIGGLITTAISWRAAFIFQAAVDRADRPAQPPDRRSPPGRPDPPVRRVRSGPVGGRHVLRGVRDPAGRQQPRADGGAAGGRSRLPDLRSSSTSALASAQARNRCCPRACSRTARRTSGWSPRTSSGCCSWASRSSSPSSSRRSAATTRSRRASSSPRRRSASWSRRSPRSDSPSGARRRP